VLPPVGSAETNAFPRSSTATHSDGDEHDKANRPAVADTGVAFHNCGVPVGLVDVSTMPETASAATHNETEGHETADNPPGLPADG
jgi:hypothetical protein